MAGRTVVVAVDDSPVSRDALSWTAKSLVSGNDKLMLLSVLEPGMRPDFAPAGEGGVPNEGEECKPDPLALQRTQENLRNLRDVAEGAGAQNVRSTVLVSCVGGSHDMARHIAEFAEQNSADVLVMGSRGMSATKRTMLGLFDLGSVSDYVVKHARCNVLVHKMGPAIAAAASGSPAKA